MGEGALLANLPDLVSSFALVLCRVAMVVALLPGLGEIEAPAVVRAGLSLAITLLMLPNLSVPLLPGAAGWTFAFAIVGEVAVGALLGWLARLPALALGMAGAIISYMTGLTSVIQPDPALGGQSAILTRALGLLAPVLILGSGLYALPLSALSGSYQLFPPGHIIPAGPALESIVGSVAAAFGLALRISGPFVVASVLFQLALGLVARLVAQLQVFTASAPGQILGGLLLLGLLAAPLLGTWIDQLGVAWAALPGS